MIPGKIVSFLLQKSLMKKEKLESEYYQLIDKYKRQKLNRRKMIRHTNMLQNQIRILIFE